MAIDSVRKCVAPIQDLIVPNGSSTVCFLMSMQSGLDDSNLLILSIWSSCSQRVILRGCLLFEHCGFNWHALQVGSNAQYRFSITRDCWLPTYLCPFRGNI